MHGYQLADLQSSQRAQDGEFGLNGLV